MSAFTTLLLVYVLGGLTFIPLLIAAFFLHAYLTLPPPPNPPEPPLERDGDDGVFKTDDEKLVRRLANSVDVAAGYFLVSREFVPGGVNARPPERASPLGSAPLPPPQSNSPSVYQSMYRTLFDRKSSLGVPESAAQIKGRGKRALNEFFVVLRHGHLMLYDDEQQKDPRHVVSLALYSVSIYGGGDKIPEGELYIRRNAICLSRKDAAVDTSLDETTGLPFYFFSENCSNKEDFYLGLVKHQEKSPTDPTIPPKPLRYRQADVISLVQRLHSSEDQLQMNWVNGLLGRVFLSIYRTPQVEQFIRSKIVKKISRVTKPSFLSEINVQNIHVGDSVPYITNPRLKEMTAEGDFCCEFDISYSGKFRLEIATKATMNLGARFKAREVGLLLQATLKRLDGHGVIRIKPPPSNRLWFSFERMPKMELLIEPIVGSTQVAWGPVLRIIESRIREVIEESVVLPYYDDIPFTDTIDQRFRGGIWHKHKKNPPPPPPTPTPSREAKDPFKEPFEAENFPTPTNEPETEEPLLTLNGQKHQSTPTLVTTPAPVVDDDKAASIMGLMPDAEEPRKARTPSIKSKDSSSSERKPKAARPPTFTSITPSPPAPSIGTETFNVSAMRGDRTADSSESTNSASSAISAIKSRTSTSPQTPSPIAIARPGRRPTSSSGMQEEAEPNDHDEPQFPMSMGSISGGSAQAFGSNYSQPNHLGTNSRSQTASSTGSKGPLESIAAIGTATAAVKKWYTTRKNSNLNGSSVTTETQHLRHLPPPTIPPPPIPKRTAPMNMPNKRKSLPPPIAPSRKSRHMAPALPPRDPRDEGEMLVVAAPESEPTTPKEERPASWSGLESWDRKDDIQSWENKDEGKWDRDEGKGGQSWDKDERKGREHSEAKGGEPSSPVKAAQSWDRKEDSAELWHPAEEAEIRNRTTWGAGEL